MQNKSKPKYITTRKLQRITYASWAWLAVSLLLLGQVLFEYMIPSGQYALLDQLSSSIIFPFYATVILLIISIVADLFYSRRVIINKEKEANKTLTKYTRIYIIMISAAFITFWAFFLMHSGDLGLHGLAHRPDLLHQISSFFSIYWLCLPGLFLLKNLSTSVSLVGCL